MTLDDPRRFAFVGREATGLVVLPFFGFQALNLAIGTVPAITDVVFPLTALMFFVLGGPVLLCMRFIVMPAWVYPQRYRGLREQRRKELRLLRTLPGGRLANFWKPRHAFRSYIDWDAFRRAREAEESEERSPRAVR